MAEVQRQRRKKPTRRKKTASTTSKSKTSGPPKKRKKTTQEAHGGLFGRSPLQMVIYGPPGVGKTDFASQFGKTGFIIDPQEEGIRILVEYDKAPAPVFVEEAGDFETLLELAEDVAAGSYDIDTVVFDSLTGMEKLCFHYHCREYFEDDWTAKGFYSYQQGPKNAAKTDWPRFLAACDKIRRAGVNVLLIAHSTVKTYSNPEGPDYDRFIPYLDKETWQQTHRWAKAVLFYNYHVDVDKKGPRNKAKMGTEERFIYTEWSPAFDSKNQYDLPPLLECGESGKDAFENFRDALKAD